VQSTAGLFAGRHHWLGAAKTAQPPHKPSVHNLGKQGPANRENHRSKTAVDQGPFSPGSGNRGKAGAGRKSANVFRSLRKQKPFACNGFNSFYLFSAGSTTTDLGFD
jgi:hypothetical protein